MRRTIAAVLAGGLMCCAASALLAAPGQGRPGEIAPPSDVPMPVRVVTTPPVSVAGVVAVRLTRQTWEYEVLVVSAAQNAGAMLTAAGRDGWEVTGQSLPSPAGTAIVLKRPQ